MHEVELQNLAQDSIRAESTAHVPSIGRRRVLLSTLSSDSHTWNLVFLQMLLEEFGHEVINLGPCVPDDLLIERAACERPDVIVISSVNGHGRQDGVRMMRRLRSNPATSHIRAMIGGKLDVHPDPMLRHELLEAGFDVVFNDDADARLLALSVAGLPERTQSEVTT